MSVVLKPSVRMFASMIDTLCDSAPSIRIRPWSVTMRSADSPDVRSGGLGHRQQGAQDEGCGSSGHQARDRNESHTGPSLKNPLATSLFPRASNSGRRQSDDPLACMRQSP